MSMRASLLWLVVLLTLGGANCAQPVGQTVLTCAASDVRHTMRVHADTGTVEDLAVTPAKVGEAEVTPDLYVFRFFEARDHYELIIRIDRATGTGTRELFDDEQQAVKGHGGTDTLVCEASSGRL